MRSVGSWGDDPPQMDHQSHFVVLDRCVKIWNLINFFVNRPFPHVPCLIDTIPSLSLSLFSHSFSFLSECSPNQSKGFAKIKEYVYGSK